MDELGKQNHAENRFVCRFAAGSNGYALSGIWRIWTAKNKPDLYITAKSSGPIKATVHCPRPAKPTWNRHWGFNYNAKGEVADAVRAEGSSRHKADLLGAPIGSDRTIEWRIFIPGTALRKRPLPVGDNVLLVEPPSRDQCLVFLAILGPSTWESGYPLIKDAETSQLSDGRLSDGRYVRIIYCYVSPIEIPAPPEKNLRFIVSREGFHSAVSASQELRAYSVHNIEDGSLGFFDLRVENQ